MENVENDEVRHLRRAKSYQATPIWKKRKQFEKKYMPFAARVILFFVSFLCRMRRRKGNCQILQVI